MLFVSAGLTRYHALPLTASSVARSETVSDRWGNREASSAHDKSGTWQRTPEEVLRLTGVHAVEFADFWPIGPSTPPNLIGPVGCLFRFFFFVHLVPCSDTLSRRV